MEDLLTPMLIMVLLYREQYKTRDLSQSIVTVMGNIVTRLTAFVAVTHIVSPDLVVQKANNFRRLNAAATDPFSYLIETTTPSHFDATTSIGFAALLQAMKDNRAEEFALNVYWVNDKNNEHGNIVIEHGMLSRDAAQQTAIKEFVGYVIQGNVRENRQNGEIRLAEDYDDDVDITIWTASDEDESLNIRWEWPFTDAKEQILMIESSLQGPIARLKSKDIWWNHPVRITNARFKTMCRIQSE